MSRFGMAGAALAAAALATSLALADDEAAQGHGKVDRMAEFAQTHATFCKDHYARAAGRMAYLGARLSLTPSQQPLFGAWRDVVLQTAESRANACANETDLDRPHDLIAREAHTESRLEERLAALQAEKPALTALYQSLSEEQKHVLDHAGRHHGQGGGMSTRHGERGTDGDHDHDHEK